MQLHQLVKSLETLAPPALQESYDNSGLLCGDPGQEIKGVLVSLDCTEKVVEEAIKKGCNVIVSHHPVIFKGLKKLTGSNYVERTVMLALRNHIALYAIHTNLDNVQIGVNRKIAEVLGLKNVRILAPKSGLLKKLVVFVPEKSAENLRTALFKAGAGEIGEYSECSFNLDGNGTFLGSATSNPYVGEKGKRHTEKETRIEVVYPQWNESQVLKAMRGHHPYEEVAYDCYTLSNIHQQVGSGMVGELEIGMKENDFLAFLKVKMQTKGIRYSPLTGKTICKIAVCGGSGSFLLGAARKAGADAFVTGDFKYHEFFDAEGEILIADIGHYESEQFTINLLTDWITKNFTTFAVHFTETNTNPVNYL